MPAKAKTRSKAGRAAPRVVPAIFCDFDGTITEQDVTDQILSQWAHPSWREVEQLWMRGAIGSRECLERQMSLVKATPRELNELIDAVPVDPGFAGLYRLAQRRGVPFYVVSDGFDYVIGRVLKRIAINGEYRNGTHLFSSGLRVKPQRLETFFPHAPAPCEHGCATCKVGIIREHGRGHRPVVFIGDGLSDRWAVEEADLVFARHPLAAHCREKDIACLPFESLREVEQELARLGIL
jgi:2-hydroxy-3-keto-5-methylthiopentenyl-1-phosphate phosphatase